MNMTGKEPIAIYLGSSNEREREGTSRHNYLVIYIPLLLNYGKATRTISHSYGILLATLLLFMHQEFSVHHLRGERKNR
ncbi:MAG: hypothetical protein BWY93_01628 [Euryarchaeota archaeon ADurb.BinA087]|nr:MAG: hypothetical protein BWY93_01628 [Euryarchaeota archaeon ADurb.BinA087]